MLTPQLNGIWCFLVLSYFSMFSGWRDMTWSKLLQRRREQGQAQDALKKRIQRFEPADAMASPPFVGQARVVSVTRKPAPSPLATDGAGGARDPQSRFTFSPPTTHPGSPWSPKQSATSPTTPTDENFSEKAWDSPRSVDSPRSYDMPQAPESPQRARGTEPRQTFNAPTPFQGPLTARDETYAPRKPHASPPRRSRSTSRGPPVPPKPAGYTPKSSPISPSGETKSWQ